MSPRREGANLAVHGTMMATAVAGTDDSAIR